MLRQAAFLALAAMGGVFLIARSGPPLRPQGLLPWAVLLYVGWCLASVLWSHEPAVTARRAAVLLCALVGALGVARRLSHRELCQVAAAVTLAFLGIGMCAELALGTFQPFSREYRFAGSVHPNTQGTYLATLCLAALALRGASERGRWRYDVLLCTGLAFLVLTRSRTSLACTLLALAVVWSPMAPRRLSVGSWLAGAWIVNVAAIVMLFLPDNLLDEIAQVALLGRSEEWESLNGRIPLWSELFGYIHQRPLLGFGYGAFWTPGHIYEVSREVEWPVCLAHSAYLETLLDVGAIGTALLGAVVALSVGRAARRLRSDPAHGFILGLLIYAAVSSGIESTMVTPLFVPFIIVCGINQLAFQGASDAEDRRSPIGRVAAPSGNGENHGG